MNAPIIHRNFLVLILLISLLTGCGGGDQNEPGDRGSSASSSDGPRSRNELVAALHSFSREHNLDELPEIVAAEEKAFQAAVAFQRFQRELPELQDLYAKSDEWKQAQIDAKLADDQEAYRKAMSEFTSVRAELSRAAAAIPAVVEKSKELDVVNEEVLRALAAASAEVNAEGKKLAKELEALLN